MSARSRGSQDLLPRVTSGGMVTTVVVCFGATKRQVVEDASPPLSIISTTTLKLSTSIFILKSKSRLRAVKGCRLSSGFEPRSLWLQACQKHRSWVSFRAGRGRPLAGPRPGALCAPEPCGTGAGRGLPGTRQGRKVQPGGRPGALGWRSGGRLRGENPTLRACLARGCQDRRQKTLHLLLSFLLNRSLGFSLLPGLTSRCDAELVEEPRGQKLLSFSQNLELTAQMGMGRGNKQWGEAGGMIQWPSREEGLCQIPPSLQTTQVSSSGNLS